jgi:hypothetical protein
LNKPNWSLDFSGDFINIAKDFFDIPEQQPIDSLFSDSFCSGFQKVIAAVCL